jgi:hypothetical protein
MLKLRNNQNNRAEQPVLVGSHSFHRRVGRG